MSLPVHKWYRYTAGFSALWVRDLIKQQIEQGRRNIIDPFAGSGTVLIEAEFQNVEAKGLESHPYIYRIAKTKLSWNENIEEFIIHAERLLELASTIKFKDFNYPKLIYDCYPPEILNRLSSLKAAWLKINDDSIFQEFNWFIITSILRITSPVGTAQWQYIQPGKNKSKFIDPFIAFRLKLNEMVEDMRKMQLEHAITINSNVYNDDARDIKSIPENWGDLIITSPPYANNYDYADATRLEMSFWGDIEGWKDLQLFVRQKLVRACTQHVPSMGKTVDEYLNNDRLAPILDEISDVYEILGRVRLDKGGKKNYHFMIVSYFMDMANIFYELKRVTNDNALLCFVIGDSAPYGVYVPVDDWLGRLAIGAGFNNFNFEKLRDRNVKWKNRKHRVPLKEGRLWINN